MFTGIIEGTGRILGAARRGDVLAVRVGAERTLEDLVPGSSIALSGCCVTAVRVSPGAFEAELTGETLARTAFEERLRPGVLVNLERPMRADGRFEGHIVQGHVDGVGTILALEHLGASAELTVGLPAALERYVVAKGSVAVEGISLTVVEALPGSFTVALIPYTLEMTSLREAREGDRANLEVDVVAKYIERLLPPGSR